MAPRAIQNLDFGTFMSRAKKTKENLRKTNEHLRKTKENFKKTKEKLRKTKKPARPSDVVPPHEGPKSNTFIRES